MQQQKSTLPYSAVIFETEKLNFSKICFQHKCRRQVVQTVLCVLCVTRVLCCCILCKHNVFALVNLELVGSFTPPSSDKIHYYFTLEKLLCVV